MSYFEEVKNVALAMIQDNASVFTLGSDKWFVAKFMLVVWLDFEGKFLV